MRSIKYILLRRVTPLVIVFYILYVYLLSDKDLAEGITLKNIKKFVRTNSDTTEKPQQKCVHPALDPFEKSLMAFYAKVQPLKCDESKKDWVRVSKGVLRISDNATSKHGRVTCRYTPIHRQDDFVITDGASKSFSQGDSVTLESDFFRLSCESPDGARYHNVHASVQWRPEIHQRLADHAAKASQQPSDHRLHKQAARSPSSSSSFSSSSSSFSSSSDRQPLSVFVLGFDSLSRVAWQRYMPKSRQHLVERLGGVELEGYNIVGDGTPSALLPILTGKMEEELPEARKGFKGAKPVNGHPWIWKRFSQQGYVTAYAEDVAGIGTYQMRMLGFKEQPTDHYMRPFYMAAEKTYAKHSKLCLGSEPRHVVFMNWFRDLFDTYSNSPKFFFGFHSEISHDDNNMAQVIDEDLVTFLKNMEQSGHLDSTLLVVMADHGARFGHVRATVQGKLEERLPFFLFRFPPWFAQQYPDIMRNVKTNSKRLSTPFDIYDTFAQVLDHTSAAGTADVRKRGLSLFQEIPAERLCSDAEVTPHYCTCLDWKPFNSSSQVVSSAVQTTINKINGFTDRYRSQCALLKLAKVEQSSRYVCSSHDEVAQSKINDYWHKSFSLRYDGITCRKGTELYQIVFLTSPNDGRYEVLCARDPVTGKFDISDKEISRSNAYGAQPACLEQRAPHLRPYCLCT